MPGDPRFDLAWLLTYWRDPGDPDSPIHEFVAEFTAREGYLTKGELVARHEDAVRNFRKRGYRSRQGSRAQRELTNE